MSDIVERLREYSPCCGLHCEGYGKRETVDECTEAADEIERLRAEVARLREFADWVDTWVSNPVGAYSVNALDGLFGMTRDRLDALKPPGPS